MSADLTLLPDDLAELDAFLGFHLESVPIDILQMDYSTLLTVAHYCGPFLFILKLDVD